MKSPRQAIPFAHRVASAISLLLLAAPVMGCAGPKRALAPSEFPARPVDALEIQLSVDDAADLDLHVTDPSLETVYFGNSPSRSGGRLDRDVRCEAGGAGDERRETIRFDDPVEGRYRVGVDHVNACRRFRKAAGYTLRVVGPGLELEATGRIDPGRFDHKALEFDWPNSANDPQAKSPDAGDAGD